MIQLRKANERGYVDHGWLQANHTFSFGGYHDPAHIGFRSLRVMNEDRIQPGQGFGMHPHRDMEIVTYVLSGALEHQDSMGNGQVLTPGEFQHMSAGTGIMHSEFNPSATEPVHLYQIWLMPSEKGIEPSYEQRQFNDLQMTNQLCLVASPNSSNDSLQIHQDASIYLSKFDESQQIVQSLAPQRHAWLQVLRGQITLNDQLLGTSDGAAVSEESQLTITAETNSEIMLFDLA